MSELELSKVNDVLVKKEEKIQMREKGRLVLLRRRPKSTQQEIISRSIGRVVEKISKEVADAFVDT